MFLVNGFEVEGDAGLVQLLGLAQREVVRSFADAVAEPPLPLRGSQFRILSMVPTNGGRRLTDLATIGDMTKQAMGEFVAELADLGFVTVAPDPADRRAKLVSLTPRGPHGRRGRPRHAGPGRRAVGRAALPARPRHPQAAARPHHRRQLSPIASLAAASTGSVSARQRSAPSA